MIVLIDNLSIDKITECVDLGFTLSSFFHYKEKILKTLYGDNIGFILIVKTPINNIPHVLIGDEKPNDYSIRFNEIVRINNDNK